MSLKHMSNSFLKVKSEWDLMLTKYLNEIDLNGIIDNYHDSMENLVNHKQTITHLIGHLNQIKEVYNLALKERNET